MLEQHILSTESVPAAQRMAYWLDAVCSLYCRLDCEAPGDRGVFGTIEFSGIGDLAFTRVRSNSRRIRRTQERIGADQDRPNALVLLPRESDMIVRQDGREALVRPGDFVLHDCTRPYELEFPADVHALYVLGLPRSVLDRHVRNLDDLTAMPIDGTAAAGQLLLSMVQTLHGGLASLHPSSALGVSEGITSIVAAGLRSLPGANLRLPSGLAAYHLARIKAHVRRHLGDPELSAASVAHAVGLSADHVSRLFRSEPAPLSRYIWGQRLEACRRDLADPRLAQRSVCDIAFGWGFSNAAHFSRAFAQQYAVPPGEWRHRMLHAHKGAPDDPSR